MALDKLELGQAAKTLHRCLHRANRSLNSTWDHTQVASFANACVSYSSMATVDVGVMAVQSGLRYLRAQALRVRTCAQLGQADQLAKHAGSLPISTRSLFGEGLKSVIANAASTARNYAGMAECFVQAGLNKPRPL